MHVFSIQYIRISCQESFNSIYWQTQISEELHTFITSTTTSQLLICFASPLFVPWKQIVTERVTLITAPRCAKEASCSYCLLQKRSSLTGNDLRWWKKSCTGHETYPVIYNIYRLSKLVSNIPSDARFLPSVGGSAANWTWAIGMLAWSSKSSFDVRSGHRRPESLRSAPWSSDCTQSWVAQRHVDFFSPHPWKTAVVSCWRRVHGSGENKDVNLHFGRFETQQRELFPISSYSKLVWLTGVSISGYDPYWCCGGHCIFPSFPRLKIRSLMTKSAPGCQGKISEGFSAPPNEFIGVKVNNNILANLKHFFWWSYYTHLSHWYWVPMSHRREDSPQLLCCLFGRVLHAWLQLQKASNHGNLTWQERTKAINFQQKHPYRAPTNLQTHTNAV